MCKLKAFGANGQRPSPEKKDFPECQAHCLAQGNGAQVAEPRSVDQLQFLARVLRKSVRTGTPSRLAVGRMGWDLAGRRVGGGPRWLFAWRSDVCLAI